MKIIDCEKQLKKVMDQYLNIDNYYMGIMDTITHIDRNNITFKDINFLLSNIHFIKQYLPFNIIEEIDTYFYAFDTSDIMTIEARINDVESIFNNEHKVYNCRYIEELEDINKLKKEENHFDSIWLLFRFLNKYVYPKPFELVNAKPDEVFLACCNAKNTIWEYLNSLELPIEPDYIIEEKKRKGEY